jgi:hypothetical protein
MYSGITKIYYPKTIGHVFMKPVQIEGTTETFFPESCFSSQFTFLPLGDASVCSEKMVAPEDEVILCIGISHEKMRKSVVAVQRALSAKYTKDPPTDKTIRPWYKQLQQ